MKKEILKTLTIGLIIYFSFFITNAFAFREFDDYSYQYQQYEEKYQQFISAKNKYLKYQALTSKDEAITALKDLILQRSQTLKNYLLVLKYKIDNTSGVIENQEGKGLLSQLDKQIVWLDEQSDELDELEQPTLEELFVLSDRIEDKEGDLKNLSYRVISEVILGKIRNLQAESVSVTESLKDKISKSQGADNAEQLNLWLKEVRVQNYLSQKEIEAAEINLWKLQSEKETKQMVKHFSNLKIDVDDAKIYLQRAVDYQKEILGALQ